MEPRYGYAKSGGLDIAYVVYGDGPVDVLVVTAMIGHIGMSEELPWYRGVVERVPSFARLIMMNKRGEGLSDGDGRLATFEDAIDDVRCVSTRWGVIGLLCWSARCVSFGDLVRGDVSRSASPGWSVARDGHAHSPTMTSRSS